MLSDCLFQRSSSLTHIILFHTCMLHCTQCNLLLMHGVHLGSDLRQEVSQGKSYFKDCPDFQTFDSSFLMHLHSSLRCTRMVEILGMLSFFFLFVTHFLFLPFVKELPRHLLCTAIGYKHVAVVLFLFGDINVLSLWHSLHLLSLKIRP